MSNLQTKYLLKLDTQKLAQHTRGKRLIHSTKHRKDNRFQSLLLLVKNLNMPCMTKRSLELTSLIQYSKEASRAETSSLNIHLRPNRKK